MLIGCCEHTAVAVAIPGPPGPAGDGGDVTEYYHEQDVPASTWVVPHGLNKQIVGALVYSADLSTEYANVIVEQLSPTVCQLWMTPPLAGIARIF